jgi:hypothetical protein
MRALTVGVPAFLLALVVGAEANVAQSVPWCERSGIGCGLDSLEPCADVGHCGKKAMRKPGADQSMIAQQESTPPPPEAPDRQQSTMPQATRQQKMETCEFGAKDQKLTGAARKTFMAKCLASDDVPARKPSAKPKTQP